MCQAGTRKRSWEPDKTPAYTSTLSLYFPTVSSFCQSIYRSRMKSIQYVAGLLLLIIVQSSLQIPIEDTEENLSVMLEDTLVNNPTNMKRHSEGTFSNDYSKYLETRRAQDFIQWLMNSKRSGSQTRRHADGTYTSDVSSYMQDQAAKEFVSWLKMGRGRRE